MAISKINLHSFLSILIAGCFISLALADALCQTETIFDDTENRIVRESRDYRNSARREVGERNGDERRYRREKMQRDERDDREGRRGERRVVMIKDNERRVARDQDNRSRRNAPRIVEESRRDDRRARRDEERRSTRREDRDSMERREFRRVSREIGEKDQIRLVSHKQFENDDSSFIDESRNDKVQENSSWERMSLSLLLGVVGYTLMTPASAKTMD